MNQSIKRKIGLPNESAESTSIFRLIYFDTLLNVKDTTLIHLAGRCQALSYANDGVTSYILFKTKNGLVLYTYKEANHEQQYSALGIPNIKPLKHFQYGLAASTNGGGVYFYRQSSKRNIEVVRYSEEGKRVWSKLFLRNDMPFKLMFMMNTSRLIVMQNGKPLKRNQLLAVTVLDANTGAELATTDYTKQPESFTTDNFFIASDSSIWITGRAFTGKKVSQWKTGRPYIMNYTDEGDAHEIDFDRTSLKMTRFIWEAMAYDAEGRHYLVGETFTSGSLGGYITKIVFASPFLLLEAMVTGRSTNSLTGSLVDNTKLHFQDVVYMPVVDSGQHNAPRFLHLTPKTYTHRGFMHTYPLAQLAPNRLVGSNHFGQVFFKDQNSVKELDLNQFTFNNTALTMTGTSIFISKDYSIQMNMSLMKNSYSLKAVK